MSLKEFEIIKKIGSVYLTKDKKHILVCIKLKDILMVKYIQ